MKPVQDLIVAKDAASGADGFIRILKEDQTPLTAGDTIADSPVIFIEQQIAGTNKTIISPPIKGVHVKNYTGQSFVAEVLQRTDIDVGTANNDTLYRLYIILKSDKESYNQRHVYDFTSDPTATKTEIANGLIAKINADTGIAITAVLSGDDIRLDSDSAPEISSNRASELNVRADYFDVAAKDGFSADRTITTTDPDPGQGTFNQSRFLELLTKGYLGNENRALYPDSPIFYTVPGATYDVYKIRHGKPREVDAEDTLRQSDAVTTILIPPGSTLQPGFEAILNAWMASTPGSFNAVNL